MLELQITLSKAKGEIILIYQRPNSTRKTLLVRNVVLIITKWP